jgi:hypothetical protein
MASRAFVRASGVCALWHAVCKGESCGGQSTFTTKESPVADELVKEAETLTAELAQIAQLQQALTARTQVLEDRRKDNKRKQEEERRQKLARKVLQLGLMKHDDATLEKILLHAQAALIEQVPVDTWQMPRVPAPEGRGDGS